MSSMSGSPPRVLDLSSTLGGAYCSRLLSAGGLDVVRAEPPDGHWLRRWSASGAAIADSDSAALFKWLAGGQRSVTVDPQDAADVSELLVWAATMDAIIWSPGAPLAPKPAIEIDSLQRVAPDVVLTALTPFGLSGPWTERAATEFTLQALSGGPALRGSRHGRP
jgi:crotonobetainyl-CoA:carnitine CoA-transferase CaiB-like acyl-CoA transferase